MKKTILAFIISVLALVGAFSQETKTLVVYFSATGTTERVAKIIANLTGGHLYALELVKAYTKADLDWTNSNSRTGKERNKPNFASPLKNAVVKNFNEYDTIYIGAPIWWGNPSWVINEFLTKNNFANKRIIPFCTSGSSPYANAGGKMQKLANGGKWILGTRFGYGATESEIKAFVNKVQNVAE